MAKSKTPGTTRARAKQHSVAEVAAKKPAAKKPTTVSLEKEIPEIEKEGVRIADLDLDTEEIEGDQSGFNLGCRSAEASRVGSVTDWEYWACLKSLTPIQVACLLVELNPNKYDYAKIFNTPAVIELIELVEYIGDIERRAETDNEGKKLSPAEWIEWAQVKGYAVPEKFIGAVAEVERKAKEAGTNTAGKDVDTNTEKPNSDYDHILQKLAEEEARKLQAAGEDNKKESVATKVAKRLDKEEAYKHYRHLSNQAIERRIRRTWKLNRAMKLRP